MDRLKKLNGAEADEKSASGTPLKFVTTGCTLLDLAIGGGYPIGRITNIVGDKSTGKTLMAIEATANFDKLFPTGKIWYREAESAFDASYAEGLGAPIKRIKFWPKNAEPFDTIEQFYNDLKTKADYCYKNKIPGLYILDSLDALSSKAEMEREFGAASFGDGKAKDMSQLFRRLTRHIERAHIAVLIISQIRANIGATFGKQWSRSGGKGLDFYASIILYLAHIKRIARTIDKQKRDIGVRIRAKLDKNKIAQPFRECEFQIRFSYGVEDLLANLEFLKETNGLKKAEIDGLMDKMDTMTDAEYAKAQDKIKPLVIARWKQIENTFLPTRKKYA